MAYIKPEEISLFLEDRKPVDEPKWLNDGHRYLLVFIGLNNGILKKNKEKMSQQDKDLLLELEFSDFLSWETDKFGKPYLLNLTWKGESLLQKIKDKSKTQGKK